MNNSFKAYKSLFYVVYGLCLVVILIGIIGYFVWKFFDLNYMIVLIVTGVLQIGVNTLLMFLIYKKLKPIPVVLSILAMIFSIAGIIQGLASILASDKLRQYLKNSKEEIKE